MSTTSDPRPTSATTPEDIAPTPPLGRDRGVRIPLTAVVGALAVTALVTAAITAAVTAGITAGGGPSLPAAVSPAGFSTTTTAAPPGPARRDPDTGGCAYPEATGDHPADAGSGGFDRLFAQTETDADTARAQQNTEIHNLIGAQAAHPDTLTQH